MKFWQLQGWWYDALFVLVPHRQLVEDTARGLPVGASVLDAGCGSGRLAEWSRAHVTGIDASSSVLRSNRSRRLVQANLGNLPLRSESFGVVVSLNVLYALKDQKGALAEMHRVLESGGELRLATPVTKALLPLVIEHFRVASLRELLATLVNVPRLLAYVLNLAIRPLFEDSQFTFNSEEELVELVQSAGFTIASVTPCYAGLDRMVVARKA